MSVYKQDVVPANRAQKSAMSNASEAWKSIKNDHRVHVGGFRQAMKIADMEEADQQAYLRSLSTGLKLRNVTLHADLADQAEGVNAAEIPVVPIAERPDTELETLN